MDSIFFFFTTSTPLLTVSEISRMLGYSQSKAYRLVRTLIKYHFLKENAGTPRYSLGMNALKMGLSGPTETGQTFPPLPGPL